MSLEKRVIETIERNLEKKREVKLESRLVEDLEADSFSKLMIIAGLEDEFSVTIDEEDVGRIEKVSDIVENLRLKHPEVEEE